MVASWHNNYYKQPKKKKIVRSLHKINAESSYANYRKEPFNPHLNIGLSKNIFVAHLISLYCKSVYMYIHVRIIILKCVHLSNFITLFQELVGLPLRGHSP